MVCYVLQPTGVMHYPITGEASPWIEINRSYRKPRRKLNHIAFGFNPRSDEHKVICFGKAVEVFTVGENTWRRIDATPPIHLTYEDPLYVDGCLYWRFRDIDRPGKQEAIMKFDIVAEKFRVIPIPEFVIDPRESKLSQTVELMEIDGRVAVLEREYTLWIMHEDADGNIEWTEEIIYVDDPDDWDGKPDLSIEALRGTSIIFLQSACSDSALYYNRNTKEFIRFPISPDYRALE